MTKKRPYEFVGLTEDGGATRLKVSRTSSRKKSGSVRDAIVEYLSDKDEASVAQILEAVIAKLGPMAPSSVRSSLNLNVGTEGMMFERTGHGKYRLQKRLK